MAALLPVLITSVVSHSTGFTRIRSPFKPALQGEFILCGITGSQLTRLSVYAYRKKLLVPVFAFSLFEALFVSFVAFTIKSKNRMDKFDRETTIPAKTALFR
jgi:hypothetical protein